MSLKNPMSRPGRSKPGIPPRLLSTGTISGRIFQSEFHWGPDGCSIYTLTVSQEDAVKWHVFTQEATNRLKSPIRYGVTPLGATASGADSLTGGPYIVEIVRLDEFPNATASRKSFNAP